MEYFLLYVLQHIWFKKLNIILPLSFMKFRNYIILIINQNMDLIIKHKSNLLDACIYPSIDYWTLYTSKILFEFINSFWLLIVLAQVITQEKVLIFHCQFHKYDNHNLYIFNVFIIEYLITVNCLSVINNLVIRHALNTCTILPIWFLYKDLNQKGYLIFEETHLHFLV